MNLLGHRWSGVGVGGLTHKLGTQILPHQARVGHGVDHGVVVSDLIGAVKDASLLPPCHAGLGAAPANLANDCQGVPNLLAAIKATIFLTYFFAYFFWPLKMCLH